MLHTYFGMNEFKTKPLPALLGVMMRLAWEGRTDGAALCRCNMFRLDDDFSLEHYNRDFRLKLLTHVLL